MVDRRSHLASCRVSAILNFPFLSCFAAMFLAVTLQAQTNEPFSYTITVPQGRQFLVIQMNSYYGRFQKGVKCQQLQDGCDAEYSFQIAGSGVSYSETQRADGHEMPPAGYKMIK
jgi:hypothetical protein